MATGRIKFEDLLQQGNPAADAIKGMTDFKKLYDAIVKDIKANKSTLDKLGGTKNGSGLKKVNKELTQSEANVKALIALNKQEITQRAKLKAAATNQADAVAQLNVQNQQQRQINNNLAKTNLAAAGSYAQLQAKMAENIRKAKQMQVSNKKEEAARKRLISTIGKQSAQLKKLDKSMGSYHRNVGNYTGAIMNMGRQLLMVAGVGGGLFMFVRLIKSSISTIREFGKQNAILAGVLGKERSEIKGLQEDAVRLGSIYPTLTSEVVQLQIAYARLGFTQKEIIDLTEDTINGSIALNAGLEETATLVGAVVKTFDDLSSSDAGMIMDELTRSTTLTSLNFEKLSTALPKVMAAANALNIPLSKTLALLGIAQDATQDASISGTSLRNIFIQLAKSGLTLEQGLSKITESQNKLTTANDMFGKRAAITALALAKNIDKIQKYNIEIDSAAGLTDKMADEQMDTLDGALKKVASSWEALILSMRGSEGTLKTIFENLAYGISLIDQFGVGGFLLGLFGGGKKESEQADKQTRDFYTVINKATEEELNQWLTLTNAAWNKAKLNGDKFEQLMLAIRLRAIAKRLYAVKQGETKTTNAVKQGETKTANAVIEQTKRATETVEGLEAKRFNKFKDRQEEILRIKKRYATASIDVTKSQYQAEVELRRLNEKQAIAAFGRIFGAASGLARENTEEFKILKTAEAIIATYTGADMALSDPNVSSTFVRLLNAAAVVITGLNNVAKINKVKFWEGTDEVKGGRRGVDSVDAQVAPKERIVPVKHNLPLLKMGVTNAELPGLAAIGRAMQKQYPQLTAIAGAQLMEQRTTNRTLKKWKLIDSNGVITDLSGQKTYLS